MDLSAARAGRYGRAASRWARLLASGRAKPGVRVFYGHDRVPAPGERAAGGTAKAQKLNERFPNSPTRLLAPLPRYDVAPARPRSAPADRAATRARRSSSTRTASRTRAGRGTAPTSSTTRCGVPSSPPTTSCTRASSRSGRPTSSWAQPRRDLGDPSQRGRRRRTSRRRRRHQLAGPSSSSAAIRPRRTGSSSRCGRWLRFAPIGPMRGFS